MSILKGTHALGSLRFLSNILLSSPSNRRYMIDASSNKSIEESFEAIGGEVGIEGDARAVIQWFSRLKEEWILLLDNADNPNVPLKSFFPSSQHGNILVTTRNADFRTLASNCSLEISTLEEGAAVELLLRTSGIERTKENEEVAQAVVNDFGCLALAVVQAGSYIATRHLDLQEYRFLYEDDLADLLSTPLGPNVEYPKPVFQTWNISYAALDHRAAIFLNLCSFLYREGLREEIFRSFVMSKEASRVLEISRGQEPHNEDAPVPSEPLIQLIQYLVPFESQMLPSFIKDNMMKQSSRIKRSLKRWNRY